MSLLRCILLLQLSTLWSFGQLVHPSKPVNLPNQPEALVRSLYAEVVARHPLGVPNGADKKIFESYLSQALLHRLDLYRACTADWFRQNTEPDLKPEVGLFENGLFSGGNEQATPLAYHIEGSHMEPDGVVRVRVRLTEGTPPDKPWVWRVEVVLVRDDGHFRVNDIIYLKDKNRLYDSKLSEYLSKECDGPRYVGTRH